MRKVFVAVIGSTVLAFGVLLLVLPGPAFIVIPAGLGILGLEFAWARHAFNKAKDYGKRHFERKKPQNSNPDPMP